MIHDNFPVPPSAPSAIGIDNCVMQHHVHVHGWSTVYCIEWKHPLLHTLNSKCSLYGFDVLQQRSNKLAYQWQ